MEKKSLSSVYPELVKEWLPTKNGELCPDTVSPKSNKKVWWKCSDCGMEWQAVISNRAAGSGCPKCGVLKRAKKKKIAPYQKSIACLYPELLKDWDYEKNVNLDPNTVYPGSAQKAWWICPKCKHHYQAQIACRVRGEGCPACAGKVIVRGINDLETWCKNNDRQFILDEWDYDKNNISPNEVAPFAHRTIWFVCKQGHSYRSIISNKTGLHTGCPICMRKGTSFQEQACLYYLEKYYPNVVNAYHDGWLGKLELDMYLPDIKTAVEYDGVTWHKNDEKDGIKNKLCKENNITLIRMRENGLPIMPDCTNIIIENRSSQALNGAIKTLLIMLTKHDDVFDVDVDRDTSHIIERYDFKRKENSFVRLHPDLINEWDYDKNGKVNPEYVSYGSIRKYWWICSECGNSFLMAPNNRTNQSQGCPKCSKPKRAKTRIEHKLIEEGSLATKMPEILQEWDYDKNAMSPESYLVGSEAIVWWICPRCGGCWRARISSRTKKDGTGCPYCKGRRVLNGYNDLASNYPYLLDEWIAEKNGGLQAADFTTGSHQTIIWTCRTCGNEWATTIDKRTHGRGCPACARKKVAIKQQKRVTCIDNNTIFESVKEAAKWAGIKDSTLVGCLKGNRKTAGGFHWNYTDTGEKG